MPSTKEAMEIEWQRKGCRFPGYLVRWTTGRTRLGYLSEETGFYFTRGKKITEHRKRYTSTRTAASGDSSMPSPDL